MAIAALAGALFHTKGIPVRHLVEGTFTYFDVCLIFITATFFMNILKESGAVTFMVRSIVSRFFKHRIRACCCSPLLCSYRAIIGSGAPQF